MPIHDDHLAKSENLLAMPDSHGHAALLLVESLIHGLVEHSVLDIPEAIAIVESADSVQVEMAEAADGLGAPLWQAHELLGAIARSLKIDDRGVGTLS